MAKTGRPPMEFSQTAADEICERIAKGESLRSICSMDRDDFIPGRTTVFHWLANHPAFANQYAHARELQAEHFVDEIVEIADSPNASIDPVTQEPVLRDPQRDRLRVDARKWVASKLAPKKYGERLALTGNDGGPIVTQTITTEATPEQAAELYRKALG